MRAAIRKWAYISSAMGLVGYEKTNVLEPEITPDDIYRLETKQKRELLKKFFPGIDGEGLCIYREEHLSKTDKSRRKLFKIEFRGIIENLFDKEYNIW